MSKTKQTVYTTRAVRWPWNKHKEQCAANSRSRHNNVRWKKHFKLSTKEKKARESLHVCKQKRNKEEEEQKGTLLCAQHIRGDAAGQQLNRGRGEMSYTTHTHVCTYLFDPNTHVLTLPHTHLQLHTDTLTQTLIDPAAAKAGSKARHEEATLWPLPTQINKLLSPHYSNAHFN